MLKNEYHKKEISDWDLDLFLMSAQLHDVGKIAVTDYILNKAEKLTEAEFEDVKNHVGFGVKIIRQIKENIDNAGILDQAESMVGSHHEKWDGTGYPYGLIGEEIPIEGRMMAIVDVYTALTTDRPHRKMFTHSEAVNIIRNGSGTHFDPDLVNIFLECEQELEKVCAV